MKNSNTQARQESGLSRRSLLRTTTGVAALLAVGTASSRVTRGPSVDNTTTDRDGAATAKEAAQSYFNAVDACDQETVRELLAENGEVETWSEMGLSWYGTFGVTLLDFEPVEQTEKSVTATVEINLAGAIEEFEYEFRRIDDQGWKVWDTSEGIRD